MALPVDYQTGMVTGHYVDLKGQPKSGTVTFTAAVDRLVSTGYDTVIISTPFQVDLDGLGNFSIELPATDDPDINPTSFTYDVVEDFGDYAVKYAIEVPAGETVDVSDVVYIPPATGTTVLRGDPGPALRPRGVVANVGALPMSGNLQGDLFITSDNGHSWGWNGAAWVDLGPLPGVVDAEGAASYDPLTQTITVPVDGPAGTASARTLGTGASQAAAGNQLALKENAGVARALVARGPLPGATGLRPANLDNWFTALNAATTAAPAHVVFIGDSISCIGTITEPAAPWFLAEYLASKRGGTAPYPAYGADPGDQVPEITSAGTATEIGTGGYATRLANTQVASFTNASCKGFKVLYRTAPGDGTITARDGAGGAIIGTINCNATAKSGNVWTSDAVTLGSHTLHLTAAGNCTIELVKPINDDPVFVWPACHSGYTTQTFIDNPDRALDLIDNLDNANLLKLVVINTLTNDLAGGLARHTNLVNAIRTRTNCDIAVCITPPNGNITLQEAADHRAWAEGMSLGVIDQATYFPKFSTGNTIDGTHPFPAGRLILAKHMDTVLTGDPLGQLTKRVALLPSIGTTSTDAAPGDVLSATRQDSLSYEDDFLVGHHGASSATDIGWLKWSRTGTGAHSSLSVVAGVVGHPGAIRIQAASGAGNDVLLSSGLQGAISPTSWRMTWNLRGQSSNIDGSKVVFGAGAMNIGTGVLAHGTAIEIARTGGAYVASIITVLLGTELGRVVLPYTHSTNWEKWELIGMTNAVWIMSDGVFIGSLNQTPQMGGNVFAYARAGGASTNYLDIDRVQFAGTGITRQTLTA